MGRWFDAQLRSDPAIIPGHGTDNDDEDDDNEEDTVLMEVSERNMKLQTATKQVSEGKRR